MSLLKDRTTMTRYIVQKLIFLFTISILIYFWYIVNIILTLFQRFLRHKVLNPQEPLLNLRLGYVFIQKALI